GIVDAVHSSRSAANRQQKNERMRVNTKRRASLRSLNANLGSSSVARFVPTRNGGVQIRYGSQLSASEKKRRFELLFLTLSVLEIVTIVLQLKGPGVWSDVPLSASWSYRLMDLIIRPKIVFTCLLALSA